MTAVNVPTPAVEEQPVKAKPETAASVAKRGLSSPWASLAAIILAIIWTIPTFGLFISSFRTPLEVRQSGWWTWFTDPTVTFENYREVLFDEGTAFSTYFVNSIVITIPSVVIPVTLATMAAYAFAWTRFKFRDTLFVAVFALQIVPLQIALLPLLKIFVDFDLNGTFWPIWIGHSIFALPLAIFLLHNFMRDIPGELVEAARVDGAGHVRIFLQIMLPLLVPVIVAFAIFQFLWVWNDLLVALTLSGGTLDVAPLTVRLAELSGTRGTAWHLLSAGEFVSMAIPLVVFLFGQRYFVRGLLAGSVKG